MLTHKDSKNKHTCTRKVHLIHLSRSPHVNLQKSIKASWEKSLSTNFFLRIQTLTFEF